MGGFCMFFCTSPRDSTETSIKQLLKPITACLRDLYFLYEKSGKKT